MSRVDDLKARLAARAEMASGLAPVPMKPPVAYYGGKTRIASKIAALLPPHRVYVEPFCGSAAVLFAKQAAKTEVINDINGDVVAFYRCMRDRTDELMDAIMLSPYARDEYMACDLYESDLDDVERARRWWVRSTQGFSGIVARRTTWASSSRNGATRHTLGRKKLKDAYDVADRLSCVVIESGDAFKVIEKHSHVDGCLFLDPPYLDETRVDAKGGYKNEMADAASHRRLAEAANEYPGTVLLSGYRSPLYDELFEGWMTVDIEMQSTAGAQKPGRKSTRTETVWINRKGQEHAGTR